MMLIAAMVAMALLVAAPAVAQDQDAESGDVIQTTDVVGGGDNSNQCVGVQNAANTGNVQDQVNVDLTSDANADGADNDGDGAVDEGDEFSDLVDLLNSDALEDLDISDVDELTDLIDAFNEFNDEAAVDSDGDGDATNINDLALDFEGGSIDVSPTNVTDCTQSVDQDALAAGGDIN